MADPDSHVDAQLVNAFLSLQLAGGLGFSIIILTALGSPNVKRNSTWYTFCLAWILSCISYTFIFLVGQQDSPNFGVCVTQAAGIYSAPSLTSCGTLAFNIDMLIGVRAASGNLPQQRRHSITLALLIVPFIFWLLLFLGFLLFGVNHPGLVQKGPNGTYCDLNSFTPAKISGLIVVTSTLAILVIQGYIGTRLFKSRKLLKDRQLTTMTVRVMVFSLLGALGLGVGFAYVLFSKEGPIFDILLALLPACGIVIFGTHADLINVWLFWRRPRGLGSETDDSELKSPSIYVPTPTSYRRPLSRGQLR
ncbi:hypothetical protein B0H17DRAFT_299303 [Mycena rosella]|uniref:Uncharacterized protein n=1 Tax=Mycena rosella TaxID=1033263 RepID=A0AAD7CUR0_MYCRO|nr:hypothetical protein B0H17DRAFT_299303 [Mycena rosella]